MSSYIHMLHSCTNSESMARRPPRRGGAPRRSAAAAATAACAVVAVVGLLMLPARPAAAAAEPTPPAAGAPRPSTPAGEITLHGVAPARAWDTSYPVRPGADHDLLDLHFDCRADPRDAAAAFCARYGLADCVGPLATALVQRQARDCTFLMEDWLDRSVRDWLEVLQWKILDQSTYDAVQTWKFPFDLWMYRELLVRERPTVIVEIGNFAGGSAMFFADLFDTLGHEPGRILAVDIDHSNLHAKPQSHRRITWIEGDAVEAFDTVSRLIDPVHDKVMVIEDASHRYQATLDIMTRYGALVTNGSYMIIEDTVLHNGVKNVLFKDPGAFASVSAFMASPEHRCGWRIDRAMERFIVSWNPRGFLQKIRPDGSCGDHTAPPPPSRRAAALERHARQVYHAQWHHAPLDTGRFLASLDPAKRFTRREAPPVQLPIKVADNAGTGGHRLRVDPVPPAADGDGGVVPAVMLARARAACAVAVTGEDDVSLCAAIVLAKSLAAGNTASGGVPAHAWEIDTPRHVVQGALHGGRGQLRGSVVEAVRTTGVAVVGPLLSGPETARLRAAITLRPEFQRAVAASVGGADGVSRYLDPLCAFGTQDCRAWDDGFVELVRHPAVLSEVERLLGPDCLVDSTAVSVQWPGHAAFGPHVDRPFVVSGAQDGNWPYSVTVGGGGGSVGEGPGMPPRDYPISVQVLWLLDNFTTSNGAFYYLPDRPEDGTRDRRGARSRAPFPRTGMYPPADAAQMVTGLAGSVVIAHGGIWHGSAPNLFSRPRLAMLVQYVPRFVRPGKRYPFGMLSRILSRAVNDEEKQKRRLMQLFDVVDHAGSPSTIHYTTVDGAEHAVPYRLGAPPGHVYQTVRAHMEAHGVAPDMCDTHAKHAEDSALQSALLNYHVCHAPQSSSPAATAAAAAASKVDASFSVSASDNPHRGIFVRSNSVNSADGNADPPFPALAFGVGMAVSSLGAPEVQELVRQALRAGVRHFDLAEMYGNQAAIGAVFEEVWGPPGARRGASALPPGMPPRDQVFITSKLWCTNMAPEHARAALAATLSDLRLDYLDAWLIHWPVPLAHTGVAGPAGGKSFPVDEHGRTLYARGYDMCDTWSAMEADHAHGRARHLGVSNFPRALLHQLLGCAAAARVRPLLNQVEAHPYFPQDQLRAFCTANNVTMQAYSALGAGGEATQALLREPAVVQAATAHGKTPAQVVLRWNVQRGVPVVSSSRRSERIDPFLQANSFELTATEMAAIGSLAIRQRFVLPEAFAFLF